MNENTRREIRKIAAQTLRDAGITEPPLSIDQLLQHVELNRDFYSLSDPDFLDRAKHRLRIQGRKLIEIIHKVSLKAVLLFDERRIVIDNDLPEIKHAWASCHEVGHRILGWHKPFFFGDTAETLQPDFQAELEDEANYTAGLLLFLGDRFTREAQDVLPTVEGLKALAKRYHASLTATMRRYVEQQPELAMAFLVSTPSWNENPADQPDRHRHFVTSRQFAYLFPKATANEFRKRIDGDAKYRRGGLVANFEFALKDNRNEDRLIHVWSFNNQHYLVSLFVEKRRITETRIIMPERVSPRVRIHLK